MNAYENKSIFLNKVAFLAMFECKPKVNEFGYVEPFRVRFLKVQTYVRCLYIRLLMESGGS